MMNKILFFGILLCSSLSLAGNQSFPRTGVLPEQITTADSVRVGIAAHYPVCLGIDESYPTFYHLSENNHLTFVFVVEYIYEPCPLIKAFTLQYDIGTLLEGDYTLQVYVVDSPDKIPDEITDALGAPFGELVPFSVQGVNAVMPVPFVSLWTVGLLVVLILLTTFLIRNKIRNKIILFSILTILFSTNTSAKQFILLLSNEPGAPTPEQIVDQATTSPPPATYLLETFNEYRPSAVGYLLFQRPYGQRLQLIEQYPEWTLAKLYRYLIVTYPEETATNDLLTSFDNDPYIVSASNINNLKGVTSSSHENSSSNKIVNNNIFNGFIGDFVTDLDISLAWSLSEGMGYIGIIDSGTDIDHEALRPFSDSNQYLGGNLLEDHYQIDLASGDLNVDEAEPVDTQGNAYLEPCDLADGINDNLASSAIVGHGTHVSGIISAKSNNVNGICKKLWFGYNEMDKIYYM